MLVTAEPSSQMYAILVSNNLVIFKRHLSVLSAYTVTSMILAEYKVFNLPLFEPGSGRIVVKWSHNCNENLFSSNMFSCP